MAGQSAAIAWNLSFPFQTHFQRLLVVGKCAQTLNRQLADATGGSQWISGDASRGYTHWLRQRYDAILVGAGTVLWDAPSLNVRVSPNAVVRQPLKIIFDPGAFSSAAAPPKLSLCADLGRYQLMATEALGDDVLLEFMPKERYAKICCH